MAILALQSLFGESLTGGAALAASTSIITEGTLTQLSRGAASWDDTHKSAFGQVKWSSAIGTIVDPSSPLLISRLGSDSAVVGSIGVVDGVNVVVLLLSIFGFAIISPIEAAILDLFEPTDILFLKTAIERFPFVITAIDEYRFAGRSFTQRKRRHPKQRGVFRSSCASRLQNDLPIFSIALFELK